MELEPKQRRRWTLFALRGYFAAGVVGCLVLLYTIVDSASTYGTGWYPDSRAQSVLMWLLLPMIPLVLDVGTFKFKYSVLGGHRRTAVPTGTPIYSMTVRLRKDAMFCSLYPSGLAVRTDFAGEAFIRLDEMDAIVSDMFGAKRLVHRSQELRGPVELGDPMLVERLIELAPQLRTR